MKVDLNKYLCHYMYQFVKEHINEVKDSYSTLGFLNEYDMLKQIKTDTSVAIWALTELCWWGLERDYTNEKFRYDRTDDFDIYTLDGSVYFRVICDENNNSTIKQMHKIPKTIYIWSEL